MPLLPRRLAASGAGSEPTRHRATALYDDVLQTAWVQPSVPPEMVRNSQRGEGGGGTPPPWGPAMSPRAGVATNWGRGDYSSAHIVEDRTFGRRETGRSGAADAAHSPQRSYTSVALAEAAPSPRSAGVSAFSRAPQPRQGGTAVAVPHAPASRRDSYEPATNTNSNNGIINTNNSLALRLSGAVRSAAMDTAFAPRGSSWNHRYMLQADTGETNESSRALNEQLRTAGWRRISSGHKREGGGSTVGGDTGEGGSEVWEWNGRRVVIHASPPKQPPSEKISEGDTKTTGDRAEGKLIPSLYTVR